MVCLRFEALVEYVTVLIRSKGDRLVACVEIDLRQGIGGIALYGEGVKYRKINDIEAAALLYGNKIAVTGDRSNITFPL